MAADFNNDLKIDLYLTTDNRNADINQADADTVESYVTTDGEEKGMVFITSGNLTLDFSDTYTFNTNEIFIGGNGVNPTDKVFTLSPDEANVQGRVDYVPGSSKGIYLSYDAVAGQWSIVASSPGWAAFAAQIDSTSDISGLTSVGFDDDALAGGDRLLFLP